MVDLRGMSQPPKPMSRRELLRSVVDKTIRSRGLRAVVAPSFDQDDLVFRIKGRIMHEMGGVESKNATFNLQEHKIKKTNYKNT